MKEMLIQMLPTLWTLIGVPLATWLGAQLIVLLNSKIKGTKWEQGALKFEAMVTAIVDHAEVELRPDIEAALHDGKLSPEEAASLKAKVIALVQKEVVPLVPEMLKGFSQPMIDMLISGTIERAVASMNSKPRVIDTVKKADDLLSPAGVLPLIPTKVP